MRSTNIRDRDEWCRLLHRRVLQRDQDALPALIGELLPPLRSRLRRAFTGASLHVVEDTAHDAIVEYVLRPWAFDELRGLSLDHYVYLVAWRDLANLLHSEAARRQRECAYARQVSWRQSSISDASEQDLRLERLRALAMELSTNHCERRAVMFWLSGHAETATLASALGAAGMSPVDARRTVKRFKDRVVARLRRRRAMLHASGA